MKGESVLKTFYNKPFMEAGGIIVAHNFRHMLNRMDTGNLKGIRKETGSTSTPSK